MISPGQRGQPKSISARFRASAACASPGNGKPSRSSSALSWSVFRICSPRPSLPITSRQLLATSSGGATKAQALATTCAFSTRTMLLISSILTPPPCSSATSPSSCTAAALRSARLCACSTCSAIRCEWFETKLIRSSWLSTPETTPPSRTSTRCTRWRSISSSASNSSASASMPISSKRAASRTGTCDGAR